jgi:phosphoribosylamine-glycine ligase
VLGVTARAADLKTAIVASYTACGNIQFENKYCRSDIGKTALDALQNEKHN